MGGFNSVFRLAADPTLPLPARYNMFIEACSRFGRLAKSGGLQPVYDTLANCLNFSRDNRPTDVQITIALIAMVDVRFRLLDMLARHRIERRSRKASGDRRKMPLPFVADDALGMLRKRATRRRWCDEQHMTE